ncbi:MAG: bifunctional diaminohydroxyphosphoribosylaminopyrimidine deaminase/5-amino-6-(5-phosphoribosylamino)uracil reductase RibD [Verrucomicrobiales bacterium]
MEMNDRGWMEQALAEAAKGLGLTAPNPPVGTVVVKDGRLLGSGWHRRAGAPHAEREALAEAVARFGPEAVRGSTVYVTLEPCCTTGRTPPCTEGLISHGVARVVYGAVDANPLHAGRADAVLAAAGIQVESGLMEMEALRLLRGFTSAMTRGRPWVLAKSAMSLDGAVTRPAGESQWLTGPASREAVQTLRAEVEGILTSAETLRSDNPALTLRVPHPNGDKAPLWRIVATRSGKVPAEARVFHDEFADRTVVLCLGENHELPALPPAVKIITCPDWLQALEQLTREFDIHRLLVEAGGRLVGSLLDARLIDEWLGWFAPLLTGTDKPSTGGLGMASPKNGIRLTDVTHHRYGDDILIRGDLNYDDPTPRLLRPAVFFDRDGVVNDPGESYYVTRWEDFHFQDGIREVLRAAKTGGRATVLITSQRGVGKGLMSQEVLETIHRKMQEELAADGLAFDAIYAYTGASSDGPGAKPDPSHVFEAAESLGLDLATSWMIGDADRDIEMGRRAGLRTIRLANHRPIEVEADFTVKGLREIVGLLG